MLNERGEVTYRGYLSSFMTFSILVLPPDFRVALAAVNGSSFSRLKGYLCLFATRCTYRIVHLPWPPIAEAIVTIRFTALLSSGLSAVGTALRLIGESLGGKELLLLGAEGKICTALDTVQGLVLVAHGCPPFFGIRFQFGHPWLDNWSDTALHDGNGKLLTGWSNRPVDIRLYTIHMEVCQVRKTPRIDNRVKVSYDTENYRR